MMKAGQSHFPKIETKVRISLFITPFQPRTDSPGWGNKAIKQNKKCTELKEETAVLFVDDMIVYIDLRTDKKLWS